MLKPMIGALVVLVVLSPAWADDESKSAPTKFTEQYQSALREYAEAKRGAKTKDDASEVSAKFADKFLAIARGGSMDPAAFDAAAWVVTNVRSGNAPGKAVALLVKNHAKSDKLVTLSQRLARRPSSANRALLQAIVDNNPNKEAQAQACLALANLIKNERRYSDYMKTNPNVAKQVVQAYGEEYSEYLAKLDDKKAAEELETLFERIANDFADVSAGRGTMGETAKRELFEIRNLGVGKLAPEIKGEDIDGVEFKLSDYRGKVVAIDFWGNW
jgi:hypothetical protein